MLIDPRLWQVRVGHDPLTARRFLDLGAPVQVLVDGSDPLTADASGGTSETGSALESPLAPASASGRRRRRLPRLSPR